MTVAKFMSEGAYPPKGYRAAYYDWNNRGYQCYPIGLHLFVMFSRYLWHMTFFIKDSWLDQYRTEAAAKLSTAKVDEWDEGYMVGLEDGRDLQRRKDQELLDKFLVKLGAVAESKDMAVSPGDMDLESLAALKKQE